MQLRISCLKIFATVASPSALYASNIIEKIVTVATSKFYIVSHCNLNCVALNFIDFIKFFLTFSYFIVDIKPPNSVISCDVSYFRPPLRMLLFRM